MTNKERTDNALNALRDLGYIVYHANDRRAMPKGMRNFPDHHVIGKNCVVYIEDKFDGDKLSDGQKEFKDHVESMNAPNVIYILNDGKDPEYMVDIIISRECDMTNYFKTY